MHAPRVAIAHAPLLNRVRYPAAALITPRGPRPSRYSLAITGCSFQAPENKLSEMLTVYGQETIHRVEALLEVQLVINDVPASDVGDRLTP